MTLEITQKTVLRIPPKDVPQYGKKDIAYQTLDKRLNEFIAHMPHIDSFAKAIEEKKKQHINRSLLVSEIQNMYSDTKMTPSQLSNISSLNDEDTFTLITAHQPSLFTGPLYYIYKICSVIKACQLLNEHYEDFNFVPVFISGSEDHDFEEINHCTIFNKRIEWAGKSGGAVGRMPIDELVSAVEEISEILGSSDNALKLKEIIFESLNASTQYKHFNFQLVNRLFGAYGLVVVDMDRKALKASFAEIIKEEVVNRPSEKLVLNTQHQLEAKGIQGQAHPRDINFFYLQDNLRTRITHENGVYSLVDSDKTFSEEEILNEIDANPERFSPNVIMRPIYQEFILPNLAYIGGGGEIAYWLERKSQFEHFKVPFPILMRRNSALLVDSAGQRSLSKLDMEIQSFFADTDDIINAYIKRESTINIDLNSKKDQLSDLFNSISEEAQSVDPTISKWIQAERTKQIKVIDQIESRLKRTIKQQEETKINQIKKLKEKLFPGNGLQERKDNFFQYAANNGIELIDDLIHEFRPFTPELLIMYL